MTMKSFFDVFNFVETNKRILIDEQFQCNSDFFIVELVRHLNYSLFLFNNTTEHFKKIFKTLNIQSNIRSVYEINSDIEKIDLVSLKYDDYDICDDVWTQRNIFNNYNKFKISVFRSGTATETDYYDHDLIIKIFKLKSGCSSQIDGIIRVFSRDIIYSEVKYKVTDFEIKYF